MKKSLHRIWYSIEVVANIFITRCKQNIHNTNALMYYFWNTWQMKKLLQTDQKKKKGLTLLWSKTMHSVLWFRQAMRQSSLIFLSRVNVYSQVKKSNSCLSRVQSTDRCSVSNYFSRHANFPWELFQDCNSTGWWVWWKLMSLPPYPSSLYPAIPGCSSSSIPAYYSIMRSSCLQGPLFILIVLSLIYSCLPPPPPPWALKALHSHHRRSHSTDLLWPLPSNFSSQLP